MNQSARTQSSKRASFQNAISEELPQVLVAGGAGFIGSHLIGLLLEQNCQVFCLDNLFSGDKKNISPYITHQHFKFIKHDLTKSLEKLNLPIFDYIFQLAGVDSYFDHGDKDLQTMLVNSIGTRSLLELAKKHGAKFLLASSPHVFSGLISQEEVKNYFGKKEDGQSYYSLAEAKRFSESLVFEYVKFYQLNARIVRVADVYGPNMPLNSRAILVQLFNNWQNRRTIKIAGDGTQKIYPTFVTDVATGVLKAMFNRDSDGKIYTLANPQETTILDFAHKLNKVGNRQKEIEFVALEEKVELDKEELLKAQEELSWYSRVDVEEGIKKTLDWLGKELTLLPPEPVLDIKSSATSSLNKEVVGKQAIKNKEKSSNSPKRFKVVTAIKNKLTAIRQPKISNVYIVLIVPLIILLLALSLPTIGFYYYCNRGINKFLQNQMSESLNSFTKSRQVLTEFAGLILPSALGASKQATTTILDLGINVLAAEDKQQQASQHFYNFIKIIFKGERGDLATEVAATKTDLDQSYQDLGEVEADLSKLDSQRASFGPIKQLKQKLETFKSQTPELRKQVNLARDSLIIVPQIFSPKDKKNYLVLMMDNNELRPGGGFINSYGFLTLENGRVLDFAMEEVDTADSQLRGHVAPPWAIKQHLGETSWYLRDANWDPDFPSSALQAEWFIDKELNKSTDGTIGITINFLQEVLRRLGPIQLLDYNETITADNLLDRALSYAEVDNVGNSGRKENFLNQLLLLIFEKMKKMGNEDWLKMIDVFYSGLTEKQLLVSLHDDQVNKFFTQNNWSGAIRQQAEEQSNRLADYLMIAEANLGINKVNYFLKRSLGQEVTILPQGGIVESLTINLENTSTTQGWPGGDYKDYLRVYLPLKSQLMNVEVSADSSRLEALREKDLDHFEEHNKDGVGFMVTVPSQEKRVVRVTYRPPMVFDLKQPNLSYAFFWQKQPGLGKDNMELKVNYPEFLKPIKIAPSAALKKGQITFSTDTNQDRVFVMEFRN